MDPVITIGTRKVGKGYPTYIIAEMSANHNNDYSTAEKMVYAAKEAGADAIKLQTFTADVHTLNSTKEYFRIGGGTLWDDTTLYDLYKRCAMPWEWQPRLKDLADDIGIDLFSAAVDPTSVAFLEDMGVPVHKVASFELVDLDLIRQMAHTGKPVIMSTGMASISEITEAVQAAREAGAHEIALLKCTSAYPAPPEEMNLRTIPDLSERFGVAVGLSDHTLGVSASVAAVALGASLIEKHFTLSRSVPGPDSSFSVEPKEFQALVEAIRETEKALGSINYEITEHEKASRVFRRSLFIVKNIRKGDLFTRDNIRSIRPGDGLKPKYLVSILGKHAACDLEEGTPMSLDYVQRE